MPDRTTAWQPSWAPAWQAIPEDGQAAAGYHHDHDEELGMYRHPPDEDHSRDLKYWVETGSLVSEYLRVQAGTSYNDNLRREFVAWLRRAPAERKRFLHGDDTTRAALVDGYLRFVR